MTTSTRGPVIDLSLSDVCTLENVDCTGMADGEPLIWCAQSNTFTFASNCIPPFACGGTGVWSFDNSLSLPGGSGFVQIAATYDDLTDKYAVGGYPNAGFAAPFTHGAVLIYTHDGTNWNLQQTMFDGDTVVLGGGRLGESVDIAQDGTIIMGDPAFLAWGAGRSVSIATVSAGVWTYEQQFNPAGGAANDFSGFAVAISSDGNLAVSGSHSFAGGGSQRGRVNTWTRTAGVWTEDSSAIQVGGAAPADGDRFGETISISPDGTKLAVASGDITNSFVEFFDRVAGAWVFNTRITDANVFQRFGRRMDMTNDRCVLGRTFGSDGTDVYVNNAGTWSLEQNLPTATSQGVTIHQGPLNQIAVSLNGTIEIYDLVSGTWTLSDTLTQANSGTIEYGCSDLFVTDGSTNDINFWSAPQ